MHRTIGRLLMVPFLIAALAMTGCLGDSNPSSPNNEANDDLDNMDLTSENGGYDEAEEQPYFGDETLLKAEVAVEQSVDATIPDRDLLEIDPMHNVYFVRIAWGQLEGDSTNTTATDWDGNISVDRGAVAVQHTIFFESETDLVVRPRTDRKSVEFQSTTTVHYDGLLLRIYDPVVELSAGANTLTLQAGAFTQTWDVADLAGFSAVYDVDALGNQVAIRTAKRPPLPCANGYLTGNWWMNQDETRGRFGGVWVEQDGRVIGFLRGHFGMNAEGEHVLFGKLIGLNGGFKGILRGTYEPKGDGTGTYEGKWHGRGGRVDGDFRGTFAVKTDALHERVHGTFEGGWSTECGVANE